MAGNKTVRIKLMDPKDEQHLKNKLEKKLRGGVKLESNPIFIADPKIGEDRPRKIMESFYEENLKEFKVMIDPDNSMHAPLVEYLYENELVREEATSIIDMPNDKNDTERYVNDMCDSDLNWMLAYFASYVTTGPVAYEDI